MSIRLKQGFDYALTILLFGFAVFLFIGILIYSRPVNVVDIPVLITDKNVYSIGDKVNITSEGETFKNARSTYDRRYVCRNGVERREQIDVIVLNTTPRPLAKVETEIAAPRKITGHNCVIQITASAEVEILPFVTKTVTEVFETNLFQIKE